MFTTSNMESSWRFPEELLKGLNNLREQNQLCDVIISVGGKSFHAHKTVLAATGDYFLAMFTSGFRESSDKKIKIDGSAAAFEILLNFAYTGKVMVSQVSACIYEVLEMACYMQFTKFVEICSSTIERLLLKDERNHKLSVGDVCKVMLLAEEHNDLQHLHEASLKYFEDHVECLKCLDVFLENAGMTLLQAFLSQENLGSEDDEKQVLELVINWLKHDWENRKKHSHQLLQKVRLGLVASEDIKELVSAEILSIPECLELVNQVLQVQALKKPRDILAIENPEIAATRSTITAPIVSNGRKFQFYAVNNENWFALDKLTPLPGKKAKYSMVVVDGILYAVGGESRKEFYSYQAGDNKWLQLPSMSKRLNKTTLVSLEGYIYAIGTISGSLFTGEPQIMMERYDINEVKWEDMKSPDSFENEPSISSVVFEGKIFVSSVMRMEDRDEDVDDDDEDMFDDSYYLVEDLMMYDPETDTWQVNHIGRRDELAESGESFLFVYNDQLYRILDENDISDHFLYVSLVILKSNIDGTMQMTLRKQDEGREFSLGETIFGIQQGAIVCISQGEELEPGTSCYFPEYYGYDSWFPNRELTSNPVWFTFDRKKLSSKYY
ncbi:kelch-like protein 25 [Amphiura filiformis]|uniref:kelch-like protein 25 n=1 Tax=Amphiura filiformis TaxID=82378 RepID=UPI003B219614